MLISWCRYQDTLSRKAAFDINDSAITKRGFTCHSTYPEKFTGNIFTLTNMDTLCIKVYSNNQTGDCFAVGFGQIFGKDWIHVESWESSLWDSHWKEYAKHKYSAMLAQAPEHAWSMNKQILNLGSALCTPVSINWPYELVSCGRAQMRMESSWRYSRLSHYAWHTHA